MNSYSVFYFCAGSGGSGGDDGKGVGALQGRKAPHPFSGKKNARQRPAKEPHQYRDLTIPEPLIETHGPGTVTVEGLLWMAYGWIAVTKL